MEREKEGEKRVETDEIKERKKEKKKAIAVRPTSLLNTQ